MDERHKKVRIVPDSTSNNLKNLTEEDKLEITKEIEKDLSSLDGYLDTVGLDLKFFAENLRDSFVKLKKGSTENRLHLHMLGQLRGLYKQSDNKVEDVTYSWGDAKEEKKKDKKKEE